MKNIPRYLDELGYENPDIVTSDIPGIFNYRWISTRNSWMIGTGVASIANAMAGGHSTCPSTIVIPRNFTYGEHNAPVEVVGKLAFFGCGFISNTQTKAVFITRLVKIIEERAFGCSDLIESFEIERGSVLEEIHSHAIDRVGYSSKVRGKKLILPSTLRSVAKDGITTCYLFDEIIYCGSNDLSVNASNFGSSKLCVSTTYKQKYSQILGQTPNTNCSIIIQEFNNYNNPM